MGGSVCWDGQCRCADNGYWYNYQTYKCEDKNECKKADKNNCSENATCKNTNGGFICTCNAGFKGDGVTCLARVISLVVLVLIYPFSLNLTRVNALSWVITGLPSNYWLQKCNGSR